MSEHPVDSHPPQGETADDLIAAAAGRGYTVSRRQLAEWHRAGLLPTPEQTYGDKAGSTSVYPAGTTPRLVALCASRSRHPRSLSDTAWDLWWAGFDVPEPYVRGPLERAAATWREGVDQLRQLLGRADTGIDDPTAADADDELPEAFLDFLDRMITVRGLRKGVTQARKRVGRERFPTLVRVLAEVLTGTFEGYAVDPATGTPDEERGIVEKALGLERARTDRVAGAGPWLTTATGETLAMLGRLVRQYPPGYGLAEASLMELGRARDEIKLFMNLLTSWGRIAEQMFGRGAFGLAAFGALADDERPLDQAMWVLLWRSLRAAELGAAIELMLSTALQWQQKIQPTIDAVQQLRAEVPATAELLDPKQIGRGLRSKREQRLRHEALLRMREEHAEELDAFFARHPKVQATEPDANPEKTLDGGEGADNVEDRGQR